MNARSFMCRNTYMNFNNLPWTKPATFPKCDNSVEFDGERVFVSSSGDVELGAAPPAVASPAAPGFWPEPKRRLKKPYTELGFFWTWYSKYYLVNFTSIFRRQSTILQYNFVYLLSVESDRILKRVTFQSIWLLPVAPLVFLCTDYAPLEHAPFRLE